MEASSRELLTRRTASEAVAEQLRSEIQRGSLHPGDRLRQGEVAARFGVSTTPVREAFALLQAQGLVRIDPHRGAIIFHPTTDDLRELYDIRESLEALAIGGAVGRLAPADLADLQRLIDRMKKTKDDQQWIDLNNVFHARIYAAASKPRLEKMINNLRDASSSYIHMYITRRPHADRPDVEHQEILNALKGIDAERADRAVRQHLQNTCRLVLQFLA